MASKHAILIGIDNTAGMAPLADAAQSAMEMEKWAKSQGFETKLFVDSGQKLVRADDIVDELEIILKTPPQQILIYFAGHGCIRDAGSEIWFLPKAISRGEEAFDLNQSKIKAYLSGVDSIIFISDACRTPPGDLGVSLVGGRSIFPNMKNRNRNTKIDMLYATWPGEPAHEAKRNDGDYGAIYTECLLTCLKGNVKEVITPVQKLQPNILGVMPFELNEYLMKAVPDQIVERGMFFKQQPMGEVTSRDPVYLAKIGEATPPKPDGHHKGGLDKMLPVSEKETVYVTKRADRLDQKWDKFIGLMDNGSTAQSEKHAEQTSMVRNARMFYEELDIEDNSTGFAINGAGAFKFYQRSSPVFDQVMHIDERGRSMRIKPRYGLLNVSFQTASVVIAVSDLTNTGFPIAIIPGFFCIIGFEEDRIISVDYFPTDPYKRDTARYEAAMIAERKAMVIAAARNGIFEGSEEAGDYLRRFKSLDPTLGLFAAYAYARSGNFEDIESVYQYIKRDDNAVLFDVELLRGLATSGFNRAQHPMDMMPILTQGWSYLPLMDPDEEFLRLSGMLKPGLWTTFTSYGLFYLIKRFNLREF